MKDKQEPYPPPRYDDVYFEGVAYLESLAGPPIEPGDVYYELGQLWKEKALKDDNRFSILIHPQNFHREMFLND